MPAFLPASLHACRYGSPHCRTGCVRDTFGIRLGFVRDSFGMPACLRACLPAGTTVLYCTTCRYGSPHCRTGCVRDSFETRMGFVRDSFGMPAFLPASLHACRYGSPHCRTGCVRDTFGIRLGFVRDSFGMPACLRACLPAGTTVLYCTTCRYGSPHCRTGCVRDSFETRMGFVRDSFGMPAFLPASLHACMQAGSRFSYQYGTSYHEYSYISRTRGRSYGTVGAAMRPRCGDPPNEVCSAVGKLDLCYSFLYVSRLSSGVRPASSSVRPTLARQAGRHRGQAGAGRSGQVR